MGVSLDPEQEVGWRNCSAGKQVSRVTCRDLFHAFLTSDGEERSVCDRTVLT
jgi:hypothetical protein